MTVLLLAGTSESRRIAWGVADTGVNVVASLAGVTRDPDPLPVPTRTGGFGGEDGFRTYVREARISAVLDTTHPFADEISQRTTRVCADLGVPYCQLVRPEWEPQEGDDWTSIKAPADAAAHIPPYGVVFLATGRQTLAHYANLEGRRVLARVIDPPTAPFPFEGGEFVIGRPPFSEESETAVMRALGVTHLVAKNAGGQGGRAKLDAARTLGIKVLMLDRPPLGEGHKVSTVKEALTWVATL